MTENLQEYKVVTESVFRWALVDIILKYKKDGWEVLYTVSLPPIPSSPIYSSVSYPVTQSYMDIHTGEVKYFTSGPPAVPLTLEGMVEVCFIKVDPHKNPCPRCSYPYPNTDRIDRED